MDFWPRADLVCNDQATGNNWVTYSTGSAFSGGGLVLNGWCSGSTSRLLTGDVNGDGLDDLICNAQGTGNNWVVYSNGAGYSGGGLVLSGWCSSTTSRILSGDINGDGLADLICNDQATGNNWVTYSNGYGFVGGGLVLTGWCGGSTSRLLTGDVNGDWLEDLICNDQATGNNWVTYSNGYGYSGGGLVLTGWCGGSTTRILTGYVNNDWGKDLICNDQATGNNWVTYSTGSAFSGGGLVLTGWCGGSTTRILTGDVNGDGLDDLLCNAQGSGNNWVTYSNGYGYSGGGLVLGGWCGNSTGRILTGYVN